MNWVNDYVGIPFAVNGRDRTGLDCWGLILLVFKERFGQILPDWTRDDGKLNSIVELVTKFEKAIDHIVLSGYAEKIDGPENMSIVLVKRSNRPHHVGIVVGRYVLHTSEFTKGSVCQPMSQFDKEHGDRSYWRWSL